MTKEASPMEQINAVTLLTSDMSASVAFYRSLGFALRAGGPDAEFTTYEVGPGFLNVALDRFRTTGGEIWGRVIIWVHDVDEQHQRVLAAGYEPATAPTDAPWGERFFHVRDPDGHELSFARPLR